MLHAGVKIGADDVNVIVTNIRLEIAGITIKGRNKFRDRWEAASKKL